MQNEVFFGLKSIDLIWKIKRRANRQNKAYGGSKQSTKRVWFTWRRRKITKT